MKIKACIFDLDGTVANTLIDIADSVNFALSQYGYPIQENERYRYFMGGGTDEMVSSAMPQDSRDTKTVKKVTEMYKQHYNEHYLDKTTTFDGIHELLTKLNNMSVKCCVLSNKADIFTKEIIKKLLPDIKFEIVMGEVDSMPLKPDPTSALYMARKIQIEPSEFLFIGDSDVDMLTAKAAGMHGVGAVWGFRTHEELKENGAKFLASNPLDILDIIKKPL